MFDIWTAVHVVNDGHPRFNEAGTVHAVDKANHPDEVVVKFDNGTLESVALSDLVAL